MSLGPAFVIPVRGRKLANPESSTSENASGYRVRAFSASRNDETIGARR
jgi:hypothetical protein